MSKNKCMNIGCHSHGDSVLNGCIDWDKLNRNCYQFATQPTTSIPVAELEELRDHKRLSIGKLKTQKGIIQAVQEMNHDLKVKTKGYEQGTHALIGIAEHQILQDKVADLAKPSEWISVDDRLPEESGSYFVCLENDMATEFNFSDIGARPYWFKVGFGSEVEENKVTHWQPLPPPPTRETP